MVKRRWKRRRRKKRDRRLLGGSANILTAHGTIAWIATARMNPAFPTRFAENVSASQQFHFPTIRPMFRNAILVNGVTAIHAKRRVDDGGGGTTRCFDHSIVFLEWHRRGRLQILLLLLLLLLQLLLLSIVKRF
jgi:hypothetical protein